MLVFRCGIENSEKRCSSEIKTVRAFRVYLQQSISNVEYAK